MEEAIAKAMLVKTGWVSEDDLKAIGEVLPQGEITVLEIGTGYGRSAVFMANLNPQAEIYTIDNLTAKSLGGGNDKENCRIEINKAFEGYSNIHFIEGDSQTVAWDKEVDFLFIDGSHLYEDVKADFEKFYGFVKPGGYVVFHDIDKNYQSASRKIYVREYVDSLGLPYYEKANIASHLKPDDDELLFFSSVYLCGGETQQDLEERIKFMRTLKAGEVVIDYGTGGGGATAISMAMANPLAVVFTFESGVHRMTKRADLTLLLSERISDFNLHNLIFKYGDGTQMMSGWNLPIAGINIDVDGDRDTLMKSVRRWLPLVKSGGKIFFQNYNQEKYPAIKEVVDGLDKERYLLELVIQDSAIVKKL